MNGNIRIGNLFGIPFYINPSWFLVLGLVTLTFGNQLTLFPQLSGFTSLLLGFVAAILLFASVLAHELGHSLAALSQGIDVKSITLFIFGGLASLEKESKSPLEAFLVAAAGPLVSLILFGIFTAINVSFALSGPLGAIVSLLASINLILALFNLLPGLPLDGGNILKSLVWKITGNQYKGVVIASRVGQGLGWLAVTLGILAVLGISQIGSFWTLLIGGFLLLNASRSAQFATVQEKLNELTAEEAVTPNSPVISEDLTLRNFVNEYVIGKEVWRKFLVVNDEGKLLGAIAVDDLKQIPTSDWTTVNVSELLQPVDTETILSPNQTLLEVLSIFEQRQLQQLPVVRENGVVMGLLEKNGILRLLQKKDMERQF